MIGAALKQKMLYSFWKTNMEYEYWTFLLNPARTWVATSLVVYVIGQYSYRAILELRICLLCILCGNVKYLNKYTI